MRRLPQCRAGGLGTLGAHRCYPSCGCCSLRAVRRHPKPAAREAGWAGWFGIRPGPPPGSPELRKSQSLARKAKSAFSAAGMRGALLTSVYASSRAAGLRFAFPQGHLTCHPDDSRVSHSCRNKRRPAALLGQLACRLARQPRAGRFPRLVCFAGERRTGWKLDQSRSATPEYTSARPAQNRPLPYS